ncbi:4'-phosphopantetheinyl transferase family protein [Fulvivirga sedimenti]|uniref:4'-phosphopantetheinyl transferase superfamily protein n=1 Tax=Fulvivirga sedimenti TaxID=2879465 RepID=A0A9X1HQ42_9BACT|nr:4'-phosphopantetheinyl transferase superfamily protein [Fulvivirga sedimenti]MCA6074152.1 4'-phosphopantetheinyl transferase superfamily protein [Fulvivirga sedimenti]
MPLLELKGVGKERLLGLYKIEEQYDELLEALNPDELDRELLESYSNVQKKQEWLAARLLLRYICEFLGLEYQGTRKDSNGKPFLQGHALQISLSHSFPYVAVVADPSMDVGIDLEQPKEKLQKIAPRFLDERELELCMNLNQEALCIFWCAKEALYKVYSKKGLNFRNEIHLYPQGEFPWKKLLGVIDKNGEEARYLLQSEQGSDYIMVYNI